METADLKCQHCGGTMEPDENGTYAICEYCGKKQKIVKSEAEIKADLLRKKEEQKAQYRENYNKVTKKIGKGFKTILIVFITIIVLIFVLGIVVGIMEGFAEDDESTTSNTTANISNGISTLSYDYDVEVQKNANTYGGAVLNLTADKLNVVDS